MTSTATVLDVSRGRAVTIDTFLLNRSDSLGEGVLVPLHPTTSGPEEDDESTKRQLLGCLLAPAAALRQAQEEAQVEVALLATSPAQFAFFSANDDVGHGMLASVFDVPVIVPRDVSGIEGQEERIRHLFANFDKDVDLEAGLLEAAQASRATISTIAKGLSVLERLVAVARDALASLSTDETRESHQQLLLTGSEAVITWGQLLSECTADSTKAFDEMKKIFMDDSATLESLRGMIEREAFHDDQLDEALVSQTSIEDFSAANDSLSGALCELASSETAAAAVQWLCSVRGLLHNPSKAFVQQQEKNVLKVSTPEEDITFFYDIDGEDGDNGDDDIEEEDVDDDDDDNVGDADVDDDHVDNGGDNDEDPPISDDKNVSAEPVEAKDHGAMKAPESSPQSPSPQCAVEEALLATTTESSSTQASPPSTQGEPSATDATTTDTELASPHLVNASDSSSNSAALLPCSESDTADAETAHPTNAMDAISDFSIIEPETEQLHLLLSQPTSDAHEPNSMEQQQQQQQQQSPTGLLSNAAAYVRDSVFEWRSKYFAASVERNHFREEAGKLKHRIHELRSKVEALELKELQESQIKASEEAEKLALLAELKRLQEIQADVNATTSNAESKPTDSAMKEQHVVNASTMTSPSLHASTSAGEDTTSSTVLTAHADDAGSSNDKEPLAQSPAPESLVSSSLPEPSPVSLTNADHERLEVRAKQAEDNARALAMEVEELEWVRSEYTALEKAKAALTKEKNALTDRCSSMEHTVSMLKQQLQHIQLQCLRQKQDAAEPTVYAAQYPPDQTSPSSHVFARATEGDLGGEEEEDIGKHYQVLLKGRDAEIEQLKGKIHDMEKDVAEKISVLRHIDKSMHELNAANEHLLSENKAFRAGSPHALSMLLEEQNKRIQALCQDLMQREETIADLSSALNAILGTDISFQATGDSGDPRLQHLRRIHDQKRASGHGRQEGSEDQDDDDEEEVEDGEVDEDDRSAVKRSHAPTHGPKASAKGRSMSNAASELISLDGLRKRGVFLTLAEHTALVSCKSYGKDLAARQDALMREMTELRTQRVAAEQESERTRAEVAQLRQDLGAMEEERRQHLAQIDTLNGLTHHMSAQMEESSTATARLSDEIARLKEERSSLEQLVQQQERDLNEIQRNVLDVTTPADAPDVAAVPTSAMDVHIVFDRIPSYRDCIFIQKNLQSSSNKWHMVGNDKVQVLDEYVSELELSPTCRDHILVQVLVVHDEDGPDHGSVDDDADEARVIGLEVTRNITHML